MSTRESALIILKNVCENAYQAGFTIFCRWAQPNFMEKFVYTGINAFDCDPACIVLRVSTSVNGSDIFAILIQSNVFIV